MNKKIIFIVVAIIIIALLGFIVVNMSKTTKPAVTIQTTPAASPTAAATETGNVKGTIKSLMTAGKSEVCSYTNQVNGANINGKMYVDNGKMRGDFTVVNSGKNETVTSHMIVNDGQNMYAWTDLSARGMKMSLASAASASGASTSSGPDVNQEVQFSCSSWTPDASLFTVPTTITFYTINAGAQTTGTTTNPATGASGCSVCDSLPAAAQSACKAQLNCN